MAKRGIKALANKVEDVWDDLRKGHIEVLRAKRISQETVVEAPF